MSYAAIQYNTMRVICLLLSIPYSIEMIRDIILSDTKKQEKNWWTIVVKLESSISDPKQNFERSIYSSFCTKKKHVN